MSLGSFFDQLAGAKEPKRPERTHAQPTEVTVGTQKSKKEISNLPLTKFALVAALVVASFYAGFGYAKGRSTTAPLSTNGNSSQAQSQNNMSGGLGSNGGFGGDYGRFGRSSISTSTVTAISSSSISVKDSSGNAATYAITSDTLITDSGSQVSTSGIQTGDSVIVIPDRTNTSDARRIIANPDFSQDQNQSNSQPATIDPSQTQVN